MGHGMRHKLNLNWVSLYFVYGISAFLAAALALYACSLALGALHIVCPVLPWLVKGALAGAAAIAAVFAVLIVIEHFQDEAMGRNK